MLLDREGNFVDGVQLALMVLCDDSQFQDVVAGFDPSERPGLAVEHSHQFAIHIGMHMVAAPAFNEIKLKGNAIAFKNLLFFG